MFLLISCVFLNILNTLSNKRDNQLCVILISIFLFIYILLCYNKAPMVFHHSTQHPISKQSEYNTESCPEVLNDHLIFSLFLFGKWETGEAIW